MNPHFFGRWSWHLLFGAVACVGIVATLASTTAASAAEPGSIAPRPIEPRAVMGGSAPDASHVAPVTANDVTSTAPNPENAYEEELETLDEQRADGVVVPKRSVEAPIATAKSLSRDADIIGRARKVGGVYVVRENGRDEPLTLEPALQDQLTSVLRSYQTPYAAIVALDPKTGRVLAMAEHSERNPALRGLTTKAIYPAASIFKIVTASALLEAGLSPDQTECFHGGKRRLSEKLLKDSQRDGRCMTLAAALGASANVIFAKLTQRHLTAAVLRKVAEKFGFNRPMPFSVPADVSMAAIPETPFELASTGAGFGDVYLSPLHGALLAAVAANAGEWRPPVLFEKDVAGSTPRKVLTPAVASKLTEMLEETVTTGTARRIFRERGFRVRGAVGKTGTLADRNPFRDYSWFVGFAPKDNPQIAVAAVIVNEPKWRIRATYVAREAMRLYLENPNRVSARSGSKVVRPE
ncbi:MAG: penicillin-binding transpeptidase domain-containing protein [Myxococcaceae bacterium]